VPKIERIRLYHYPASRSARARWALLETYGDAFEVQRVDLYAGEQYNAAYLERNPNHAVPMLEVTWTDGSASRMIESAAMVELLVDAHPDKALSPPPSPLSAERMDYLQMLHFGSTWMDMMLWQVRIHEHVLPAAERDARTAARYRAKFAREVEPQLRRRLERTPYICGDRFGGADIIIGHNVSWARGYRLCTDDVFRHYLSLLSKRAAFQQAFADAREFHVEPPPASPIATQFSG
jgi:glutathione S-transferase